MKLNIAQRLQLFNLLNEFKGQITGLYKLLDIVKQVELSEKEIKDIEVKFTEQNINWNAKKDKGKNIELDPQQINLIKSLLEAKNQRNEFTIREKVLLEVADLLGISIVDEEKAKTE